MSSESLPSPAAFTPCDIALVTWANLPGGTPDDAPLLEALKRRGIETRFLRWDDPDVDWAQVGLAVLRSPWDYFKRIDEFRAWLDAAEFQTRLVNSAPIARWNTDKRYFRDLEARDVRMTPTIFVDADTGAEDQPAADLKALCDEKGWDDVVVKPTVSGGSFRTGRFMGTEIADTGQALLEEVLAAGDAIIQPYLPLVESARERSLMFIGGHYSHAVLRSAFNPGGQHAEDPYTASDQEIDFARNVTLIAEEILGEGFAYARVDILPDGDGPLLMELELTEPSLFFIHRPEAAEALAELLVGAL